MRMPIKMGVVEVYDDKEHNSGGNASAKNDISIGAIGFSVLFSAKNIANIYGNISAALDLSQIFPQ